MIRIKKLFSIIYEINSCIWGQELRHLPTFQAKKKPIWNGFRSYQVVNSIWNLITFQIIRSIIGCMWSKRAVLCMYACAWRISISLWNIRQRRRSAGFKACVHLRGKHKFIKCPSAVISFISSSICSSSYHRFLIECSKKKATTNTENWKKKRRRQQDRKVDRKKLNQSISKVIKRFFDVVFVVVVVFLSAHKR